MLNNSPPKKVFLQKLTFDHQILMSLFLSSSGRLFFRKSPLSYCVHNNGMDEKPQNIILHAVAIDGAEAL